MKQRNSFGLIEWLTAAVVVLALSACGSEPSEIRPGPSAPTAQSKKIERTLRTGYTCCNLHYSGDVINDANLAQLPFIPLGSPVRIKQIEGARVDVEINGRPMQFVLENGRESGVTEQWLARIVVAEDPRVKVSVFPPQVREAVLAGKLLKGMSKDQVIMAVGYPQMNGNFRLNGPYWRYWWSSYGAYYVYWSKSATVSKIDGQSETVNAVTYKSK